MEETISLEEIFNLLKKRWLLIIGCMIVGLGAAFGVTTFFITPKYSASTQLITQTPVVDNRVSQEAINSNLLMINTYKDLIKSQVIVDKVREDMAQDYGFQGSASDISQMISVNQTQNSQMFSITVTSTSPEEAAAVANTVAKVFQKEGTKLTDTKKVTIASKAEINRNPVSPNKKINTAIGAVLGLVVGVLLALLLEFFDRTVKNEDFIIETLELPVLGTVSIVNIDDVNKTLKNQGFVLDEDMPFSLENSGTNITEDAVDGLDMDAKMLREAEDMSRFYNVSLEEDESSSSSHSADNQYTSRRYRSLK